MAQEEWITVGSGDTAAEAKGGLLAWLALNNLDMPPEEDIRVYHDTVEGDACHWRVLVRAGSAPPSANDD